MKIIGRLVLASVLAWSVPGFSVQDTWTGVGRVVAVGDVHGDYEQLVAVLRSAGLLDVPQNWSGGRSHLVQTGDLIDRGPDSRKVLDLLIKLEKQAAAAGGRVHALIGNHEAMNLFGDLRYVSQSDYTGYRNDNSEQLRASLYEQHVKTLRKASPDGGARLFDDAYRLKWEAEHPLGYFERQAQFSSDGRYGKWIRSHNAAVKIGSTLFLHGGISPKYADFTLKKINDQVRRELDDPTLLKEGMIMDPNGPLWFRGLAKGDEEPLRAHLHNALQKFGVERLVLGHTVNDGAVMSRFGGKVLIIDVGLSKVFDKVGRIACLVIEKGQPYALHRGRRLELPSDSGPDTLRYLKQASALNPQPSSLSRLIAELEAGVATDRKR